MKPLIVKPGACPPRVPGPPQERRQHRVALAESATFASSCRHCSIPLLIIALSVCVSCGRVRVCCGAALNKFLAHGAQRHAATNWQVNADSRLRVESSGLQLLGPRSTAMIVTAGQEYLWNSFKHGSQTRIGSQQGCQQRCHGIVQKLCLGSAGWKHGGMARQ